MLNSIKKFLYKKFRTSFSKSGEDIQVSQILKKLQHGFYIDIGAHHPIHGSNTYFFYLRHWRGICIDPNPDLGPLFKKIRPHDKFIEAGVSDESGSLDYYQLQSAYSTMNTFSKNMIDELNLADKIEKHINIPVLTLKEILMNHVVDRIDYMNIDCEGWDLKVLKGNDWDKFRPTVITIETHYDLYHDMNSELNNFLSQNHYKLIGKSILQNPIGSLIYFNERS